MAGKRVIASVRKAGLHRFILDGFIFDLVVHVLLVCPSFSHCLSRGEKLLQNKIIRPSFNSEKHNRHDIHIHNLQVSHALSFMIRYIDFHRLDIVDCRRKLDVFDQYPPHTNYN